jgi:hypothetical protein
MRPRRNPKIKSLDDRGPHSDVQKNYIIQVSGQPQTFSMSDAQSLLGSTGVVLDEGYGPISANRSVGLFILRGRASSKARQEAEKLVPGIRFFGDPRIGPASPPVGRPAS